MIFSNGQRMPRHQKHLAYADTITKTCKTCNVEKQAKEFGLSWSGMYGRQANCLECAKIAQKKWRDKRTARLRTPGDPVYEKNRNFRQSIKGRAWQLRQTAAGRSVKRTGSECTVSLEKIIEGIEKGYCCQTGIAFNLIDPPPSGMSKHPYAPSMDQIIPNGGYNDANIQIVCWAYNIGKQQMSDDEYKKYILDAAEFIRKQ